MADGRTDVADGKHLHRRIRQDERQTRAGNHLRRQLLTALEGHAVREELPLRPVGSVNHRLGVIGSWFAQLDRRSTASGPAGRR